MQLPFTEAQFLDLFAAYNTAIWPVQLVMYLLGAVAVAGLFKNTYLMSRGIVFILAFMWMWTGVVYHLGFFSRINSAAVLFGALFFFQGLVFLMNGISKKRLNFQATLTMYDIVGGLFIIYAGILYPILGIFSGHGWPRAPIFGVTPCPVVVFTFGVLLFLKARISPTVILIPFLWSLIGATAVVRLGMYEDFGLLIAGVFGSAMIVMRNRRLKEKAAAV
ncbi:DUF6064 family protein [Candidatus Latescibacterota bacterium]